MTKEQAVSSIYNAQFVECSKEEYLKEIRTAIQNKAAEMVDQGQHVRAIIMLEEVRRLDALFNNQ